MRLKTFLILLIPSIIAISGFGFFDVGAIEQCEQDICHISFINNSCNSSTGRIIMTVHHISKMQALTQSVVKINSHSVALEYNQKIIDIWHPPTQTHQRITKIFLIPKNQFLRWLSFHRKRNPKPATIFV